VTIGDRLHVGVLHEANVRDRLEERGWHAYTWGQGLFCDDVRTALLARQPAVLWRWIPDLIAVKGPRLVLVDPKTDLFGDTDNFSIEILALTAHKVMTALGLAIVYVWQDFTTNTPDRLRVHRWVTEPHPRPGRGSGTPFALVYKADQHPFEWAFR
jgi:hypothetical protein